MSPRDKGFLNHPGFMHKAHLRHKEVSKIREECVCVCVCVHVRVSEGETDRHLALESFE